jgi:hypothetical protein
VDTLGTVVRPAGGSSSTRLTSFDFGFISTTIELLHLSLGTTTTTTGVDDVCGSSHFLCLSLSPPPPPAAAARYAAPSASTTHLLARAEHQQREPR